MMVSQASGDKNDYPVSFTLETQGEEDTGRRTEGMNYSFDSPPQRVQ